MIKLQIPIKLFLKQANNIISYFWKRLNPDLICKIKKPSTHYKLSRVEHFISISSI